MGKNRWIFIFSFVAILALLSGAMMTGRVTYNIESGLSVQFPSRPVADRSLDGTSVQAEEFEQAPKSAPLIGEDSGSGNSEEEVRLPEETHLVCTKELACVRVLGIGENQCASSDDCVLKQSHSVCLADGSCVMIKGSGEDKCRENSDCVLPESSGSGEASTKPVGIVLRFFGFRF